MGYRSISSFPTKNREVIETQLAEPEKQVKACRVQSSTHDEGLPSESFKGVGI